MTDRRLLLVGSFLLVMAAVTLLIWLSRSQQPSGTAGIMHIAAFRSLLKELIQQHRVTNVEIREERSLNLETYIFQVGGDEVSVRTHRRDRGVDRVEVRVPSNSLAEAFSTGLTNKLLECEPELPVSIFSRPN